MKGRGVGRGSAADWGQCARGLPLLMLLIAFGVFISLRGRPIRSGEFLIGDCPYYASTAVSIWTDGDLDLRNQLRGGLEAHQRQVALGLHGEWYPKHPILMPLLTVPLYAIFGVSGFLLFNGLVLAVLGGVLWGLCRRHVGAGLSTLATASILAGTYLRAYVYNYSPDLFSALLFLAALLLLLDGRFLPAGALLGLSVMAKITNLFGVLIVAGILVARHKPREALRLGAGALPCLIALAALNTLMFGGPATTGYDRTLVLENGSPVTVSHRGFFDLPLLEGIRGQLFAERTGLLTTSPLLLLALPGLLLLLRRDPWEGLLFVCLWEFTFLLFSTYRWWATSHYGNRFLMIPVALTAVPLALTLEWVRQGFVIRRWGAGLPEAAMRER
jgi:hypothetical protein